MNLEILAMKSLHELIPHAVANIQFESLTELTKSIIVYVFNHE
jgi:hypothetical protein